MIDFQGLLAVLSAAENERYIEMRNWQTSCGTAHCMIGAFCVQNSDRLHLKRAVLAPTPRLRDQPSLSPLGAIAVRFGITEKEAGWLFASVDGKFAYDWRHAWCLNKDNALARLRKFIYYKLHKQEMIIETGRNKQLIDTGRNISGRQSASLASCQ